MRAASPQGRGRPAITVKARVFGWAGLIVLLLGAGYVGYSLLMPGAEAPQDRPAEAQGTRLNPGVLRYPQGAPQLSFIEVKAVEAMPEPLLDPLNARVAYDENHTARVSSPIAGRAVRIEAQPGDAVRAGQPLLVVDSPDYAAAIADLRKSDADLRQKRLAFDRAETLFKGEVLARRDFESADTDVRQAEAENSRARLRLANLNPGGHVAADRYVLRSAIAGVVAERQVNPGAEVRPDAPNPLFVVTDPTHLWVIIDLPERHLGRVAVGQKVSIEVDAYPGTSFWGKVASIGEVLDPATRRVQVRCVVDNPGRRLKPEMFARVTPVGDERIKLMRIPNSALVVQGLHSFVFVEKEPGVFEKRLVTLGLQGRDESYVKQGLAAGEHVVTKGALLLNSELATTG